MQFVIQMSVSVRFLVSSRDLGRKKTDIYPAEHQLWWQNELYKNVRRPNF